jgi:catechol 2,3-dioxygenase-like lactoylglutathione lyase family enzyme
MIEHVSVPISDYKKSKQFYLEALKPLDYVLGSDYPSDAAGFFEGGHTSFWIVRKTKPVQPIHVALRAASKEAVHQFHSAALKAGAQRAVVECRWLTARQSDEFCQAFYIKRASRYPQLLNMRW